MSFIINSVRSMCENLYRSKLLTTVSVITTGVLLFFLLIFSLVLMNIRIWINDSRTQPQISVYFSDIDSAAEADLVEDITAAFNPASANFITRDSSYKIFEKLYGNEMLASVDTNPFPSVLQLSFARADENKISAIVDTLGTIDGVESVVYSQEFLKNLSDFRRNVIRGMLIFAVIMVIVVFFSITNTVKLSVYAREDMIRNIQYIGAGSWYIRMPFILEGITQGVLGALLSLAALVPVKVLAGGYDLYFGDAGLFAFIVFFGGFLGFIGSFFAVKRFIKI